MTPRFFAARRHFAQLAPATAWAFVRAQRAHACGGRCCRRARPWGLGATPPAATAPTAPQIATQADAVLTGMQQAVEYAFAPAEMIGQKMMDASRALTALQADALRTGADELGAALERLSQAVGESAKNLVAPTVEEAKDLLWVPLLMVGGLVGLALWSAGGQAALASLPAVLARTARPL